MILHPAPCRRRYMRCVQPLPSASTAARLASPYISWFVARLPRADMASPSENVAG